MASRHISGTVAALLMCASPALEAREGGSIQGWVEDAHGVPVSGALVSVFGRGLRGGGLVAFTDSGGHVSLPVLPAGSYTLRALGRGQQAGAARQITVLPDQNTFFSLSLAPPRERASSASDDGAVIVKASMSAPEQDAAQPEPAGGRSVTEGARELRWLLRHKRRSTLETLDAAATQAAAVPSAPRLADLGALGGTFVFVAHAPSDSLAGETPLRDDLGGLGLVKLQGRLSDNAQWMLGGVLAENQARAWRMAAEFVVETEDGHTLETGSGYGRAALRPTAPGGADSAWAGQMGAMFLRDRYQVNERFAATLGTRLTYYGFLNDRMHLDPSLSGEWKPSTGTLVRGTVSARTLAPGGDMLTLQTLAAPALAYALLDPQLRPERVSRYELAVSARAGLATFTATAFHEGVGDQLVNVFGPSGRGRSLHIVNGRGVAVNGGELTVAGTFGRSVTGRLSYATGHARRAGGRELAWFDDPASQGIGHDGSFHDVSARVEAVLQRSDTRLVAYCRLSALDPEGDTPALARTRFDVQLIQGLPFIGDLTRADWDLLLGLRNLYYEEGEGATLDEWATLKAPKRVVGGISVKF